MIETPRLTTEQVDYRKWYNSWFDGFDSIFHRVNRFGDDDPGTHVEVLKSTKSNEDGRNRVVVLRFFKLGDSWHISKDHEFVAENSHEVEKSIALVNAVLKGLFF